MTGWIAYVGPFPFPTGKASSRRVRGVARAIAAGGWSVTVISAMEGSPEAVQLADASGRLRHASTNELMTRKRALKAIRLLLTGGRRARRWIESQETLPDAVLVYGGSLAYHLSFRRWTRSRGIPLLHDVVEWYDPTHVMFGRFGPFSLASMLEHRLLHRRSDGLIVISSWLQKFYGRKDIPCIAVPSTAELLSTVPGTHQPRESASNGPIRVLYAGHPGKKDDLKAIIEAAAAVDGIHLLVAGPAADQIQDLVPTGFSDRFSAVGNLDVEELRTLLHSCDFTTFLRAPIRSNLAGFPTKFAESVENSVPVIANLTSDLSDHLLDGVNGFVVEGPTSSDLARAFRRAAATTEAERRVMAGAARSTAEALHWGRYVDPLSAFLVQVGVSR